MSSDKRRKSGYMRNALGVTLELSRIIGMAGAFLIAGISAIKIIQRHFGNINVIAIEIGIIAAVTLVIELVLHELRKPIYRMENEARNDIEFDENGLYREKNEIQKLSKKEREELGKQRLAEVERVLGTGTLRKITKDGSDTPMKDLKAMRGLIPVKRKVKEIDARIRFDKENGHKSSDSDSGYHMCLFGNPGTGKTTIVKILTGILYKNGIIKHNEYLETDGNFLRGDTAKETNEKIELLVRFSKGKVLFIDEAYAMFNGDSSMSQDVIATLIKLMEDYRKDFILIVAGYEDEMKQLIEANPGFKSRITNYLHFPNYTNEELCDIFSSMANAQNFYVPEETRERLTVRFENERHQRYFGNARTARNVLNESISKHALNLKEKKLKQDDRFKITPMDVSVNVSAY